MLHRQTQSQSAHYAVGVNHDRTCVLLQLGEDIEEAPGHVQIRLRLTVKEADDIIALLEQAKSSLEPGT